MKYSNVLLISDLDGTLLDENQHISPQNREALKEFVADGGCFAIATGRSREASEQWCKTLPINSPCIFYNGSLLCDYPDGEIYAMHHLNPLDYVDFISKLQQDFPHIAIEFFTQDGLFFISDPQYKDPLVEKEGNPHQFAQFDTLKQDTWFKILLCAEHEELLKVEELLKQCQLLEGCNAFYSQPFYLEITPKNSSKGKMLLKYRELENYRNKYMVCVGDYDNDCEMFENADLGIAVGNASEKAKQVADWICVDHNQHPFVEIIKKIKV